MGDFTAADLRERFSSLLDRCDFGGPGTPLACAVSGGPDSSALAVLGVAAGCDVTLIHVDHGLRPDSHIEANIVGNLAGRLGARFVSHQVAVPDGPNLEARCRDARWSVLPTDSATGHTADDRAETVLINLLRGAGTAGVATMARSRRHPLAAIRRVDTHRVCRELDIETVNDPTNADARHLRNRIRHEVLPLLADVAGRDVTELLCRHGDVAAAELQALESLAAPVDPCDAKELAQMEPAVAAHAIRRWMAEAGRAYPPDAATVARVLAVAAGECVATDAGGGWRVRRSEQRLYLSHPESHAEQDA